MSKEFVRLKFGWLEQIADDDSLPPMAARVAIRISAHLNAKTERARPSYARIAQDLNASEWGVIKVVKALVERGHLRIEVQGRRGSGHANEYALVIKSPSDGAQKPQRALGKKPQPSLGFPEPEKPQQKGGKNPNGRWDEPYKNPNPLTPSQDRSCGQAGASSAAPSAPSDEEPSLAGAAQQFLDALPRRPAHVASPTPRVLRALRGALATGATMEEILAGAEKCRAFHVRQYGDGSCLYAPSPAAFLVNHLWKADWKAPPPSRRRRILPGDLEAEQAALLSEIRAASGGRE